MWSKNVSVYPWVGERYSNPVNFKSKTLFLGESNYTEQEKFGSQLVINCVIDDISPDSAERDTTGFCKFSTKIRHTVFGPDETVGPYGFWQDVAFYNFVQFLVGEEARKRPANEMWRDSVPAFEEIVSSLQPDKMIVLGKANWRNLINHVDSEIIDDFSAKIKLNSRVINAGYMNHPSSSLSYNKWTPIVQEFLQR